MQAPINETEPVSRASRCGSTSKPLFVPLLLSLPAWLPLMWTAIRGWLRGQVPTAFVQYDLPYYLANGRQSFAQGFHFAYGNPYAGYGTPAIYFQPHVFLLGFLQWAGLSPDAALVVFGIAATSFTSIVAAKLYEEWAGWQTVAHKLGLVCLFWGGGVLSLTGAAFGLAGHIKLTKAFFLFDPSDGWWMLNFGRNLVYPTEAYYHGLFLLAILFLIRKRFSWTLGAAALLSASHPFSGISLALLLVAYSAMELLLKSGAASWRLFAGSCAVSVMHLGYYMVFLNRFSDHRALEQQWQLDWPYVFWSVVPALYLVGLLAFGRLTHWKNLAPFLAQPRMRLCLVWFAVIVGLTQHDLILPPRQPLHFAHGYDWLALFLLATPALFTVLEKMLAIRRVPARVLALACFLALFLSDNILWLTSFADETVQRYTITLSKDQQNVFQWLDAHAAAPAYVASTDRWISYLTPTYTKVRSWSGHDYNTPNAAQRLREVAEAFSSRKTIPTTNPVYYIPARSQHWTPPAGSLAVYANASYEVWLYQSAP